jgi:hypothetical protein
MLYEQIDIIFGLRASTPIKITRFIFYRNIMLACVINERNPTFLNILSHTNLIHKTPQFIMSACLYFLLNFLAPQIILVNEVTHIHF